MKFLLKIVVVVVSLVCSDIVVYSQDFCRIENGYVHIVDNPKAMGVDFSFRVLDGWGTETVEAPHLFCALSYESIISLFFGIEENVTFFSKKQAEEIYDFIDYEGKLLKQYENKNGKIITSYTDLINTYPTRVIHISYNDRLPDGQVLEFVCLQWIILYEDYIISISAYCPKKLISAFSMDIAQIAHSLTI